MAEPRLGPACLLPRQEGSILQLIEMRPQHLIFKAFDFPTNVTFQNQMHHPQSELKQAD